MNRKVCPYPATFFFVCAESGSLVLRGAPDDVKMESTERNTRYVHEWRAFQKSKCHVDFYCDTSMQIDEVF